MIKFISYLHQVSGFLCALDSFSNKTDLHDITESGVKYHKQPPHPHPLFFLLYFPVCQITDKNKTEYTTPIGNPNPLFNNQEGLLKSKLLLNNDYLNQDSSKMLFGLVCLNVFGTDWHCTYKVQKPYIQFDQPTKKLW